MEKSAVSQPIRRDWLSIILTVIIGLVGTSVFASAYNSITTFSERPYVQILIEPDHKNVHRASFVMSNTGGVAATHLQLVVLSPERVINYSNFSTENISLTRVNTTVLEGNVRRLVQGDGSFVEISLTIAAKPNINYTNGYRAYATFDQGSIVGGLSLKPNPNTQYIYYIVLYGVGSVVYYFATKWVYKYLKERRRRQILSRYELEFSDIKNASLKPAELKV